MAVAPSCASCHAISLPMPSMEPATMVIIHGMMVLMMLKVAPCCTR
jgi:hypothetical protein